MPKGVPVWSHERDDMLRKLFARGCDAETIRIAIGDERLTRDAVSARLRGLGLRAGGVKPAQAFWSPEVDKLLRELWLQEEPRLTTMEIVEMLPKGATELWVRQRAKDLGLMARGPKRRKRAGEHVKPSCAPRAERAKPRIVYPAVTGCTFIDPRGDGSRCGKGRAQTCSKHQARIAPLSRGALGFVPTHSRIPVGLTGGRKGHRWR